MTAALDQARITVDVHRCGSWRSDLPIHPAADLFPPMTSDELRELGADIVKNGLTIPVALWQAEPRSPQFLLDGRNRLDAIELATGCSVIIRHYTLSPPEIVAGDFRAGDRVIKLDHTVDPYAYVISANIHRRHFTREQKRDLVAKLLKATPERSNRQIAETVKADHKTVASVRAEKEATGEIPQLIATVGKDGKMRKRPTLKVIDNASKLAAANDQSSIRDDVGPSSPLEIEERDVPCDAQRALRAALQAAYEAMAPEIDDNEHHRLLAEAAVKLAEFARICRFEGWDPRAIFYPRLGHPQPSHEEHAMTLMVYIAGSLRNKDSLAAVFNAVRDAGHEITADWRNSPGPAALFGRGHRSATLAEMAAALAQPDARAKFAFDRNGIERADVVVLALPCGRSAHMEAGFAVGRGKTLIVLAEPDARVHAELMYAFCDAFVTSIPELLRVLGEIAEDYGGRAARPAARSVHPRQRTGGV